MEIVDIYWKIWYFCFGQISGKPGESRRRKAIGSCFFGADSQLQDEDTKICVGAFSHKHESLHAFCLRAFFISRTGFPTVRSLWSRRGKEILCTGSAVCFENIKRNETGVL